MTRSGATDPFRSSNTSLTSAPAQGKNPSRNALSTRVVCSTSLRNAAALLTASRSRTPRGPQDDPSDVQRQVAGGQVEDGPPTTDLDVVGVRADDQDLERPVLWSG
jgi:hypothetical protein